MRYCRSPHSPSGCSLADWLLHAAALGLGLCPKPCQGFHPWNLTRALPLTRFRCGGGYEFCPLALTMRYCRSPHSPSGCSLADWLHAAALGLGLCPKPCQGFHPWNLTRVKPLTRFRCGGGYEFCPLALTMRYCRSPHSPSGCSLADWLHAAALGLGLCPKTLPRVSPLEPDKGFALDPVPLRRGL